MVGLTLFVAAALAGGALVALVAIHTGVAVGWIGALALLAWAVATRIRWARAERAAAYGIGAPERALRLRAVGVAVILGHMATALAHPALDLRLGNGNSLAIDSWNLGAALALAALIFRRDGRVRDERHDRIVARGVAAGYAALAIMAALAALFLAFAPHAVQDMFTRFAIANALNALILASYLVMLIVQLVLYRRDAAAAERNEP